MGTTGDGTNAGDKSAEQRSLTPGAAKTETEAMQQEVIAARAAGTVPRAGTERTGSGTAGGGVGTDSSNRTPPPDVPPEGRRPAFTKSSKSDAAGASTPAKGVPADSSGLENLSDKNATPPLNNRDNPLTPEQQANKERKVAQPPDPNATNLERPTSSSAPSDGGAPYLYGAPTDGTPQPPTDGTTQPQPDGTESPSEEKRNKIEPSLVQQAGEQGAATAAASVEGMLKIGVQPRDKGSEKAAADKPAEKPEPKLGEHPELDKEDQAKLKELEDALYKGDMEQLKKKLIQLRSGTEASHLRENEHPEEIVGALRRDMNKLGYEVSEQRGALTFSDISRPNDPNDPGLVKLRNGDIVEPGPIPRQRADGFINSFTVNPYDNRETYVQYRKDGSIAQSQFNTNDGTASGTLTTRDNKMSGYPTSISGARQYMADELVYRKAAYEVEQAKKTAH